MRKPYTLYIDSDIIKKIDELAKKEKRSRSKIIEMILEEKLKGGKK